MVGIFHDSYVIREERASSVPQMLCEKLNTLVGEGRGKGAACEDDGTHFDNGFSIVCLRDFQF